MIMYGCHNAAFNMLYFGVKEWKIVQLLYRSCSRMLLKKVVASRVGSQREIQLHPMTQQSDCIAELVGTHEN